MPCHPAFFHPLQEMRLSDDQRSQIEALTEAGDIYTRLAASIAPGEPPQPTPPFPALPRWGETKAA